MSRKTKSKTQKSIPWLPIAFAALVVMMIILALTAFQPSAGGAPDVAKELPREVSVDDAHALRDQGAFILDVRQPEEWNEFHIPDATLIPLGELPARLDEVPQDQPVVVVCRSGNRSASGRDILLQAGYANVTSMAGGMNQWVAAGYPTTSGP